MYFGSFANNPMAYIFIAILVIENLSRYIGNPTAILSLVLTLPGIVIAIAFHEFAHAWAADKLGDETPRQQKRLTLNPIAHIDPIGFLLLLFAGFGWGKPVQINPVNFRRTISMKKGNALVALAGPLMNFLLVIVFSIIVGLIYRFALSFALTTAGSYVMEVLEGIIMVNASLGVFNLIPLPPLDGSKILVALLPKKASEWYTSHERILYIVFIVIWITPIAAAIIRPLLEILSVFIFKIISLISGIPLV
jgi:Zn-dependent protease